MNGKKVPAIITGVVFFTALAAVEFFQPLKLADFLDLGRAVLLVAGAYILGSYYGIGERPGAGQGIMGRIHGLAYNLCFAGAGIIMLRAGFRSYGETMIWRALLFFLTGLALVFMFFLLSDQTGRDLRPAGAGYRQDPARIVLMKLAAAVSLSLLGVYFIKTNHLVCANLAFIFAVVQLTLVFRQNKKEPVPEAAAPAAEPGNTGRVVSLAMTAFSFFIYYISFLYLQAYNIQACMIYFILGSALFGMAPSGSLYFAGPVPDKTMRIFDIVYSLIIFTAGILIFSHELMEIPPGIHGDEVIEVNLGKQLADGLLMPVFNDNGQFQLTVLHNWIIGMAGKFFGHTIITGRWMSIITGASILVFVYLLVKELFNRRAAVLASAFLSCFFMQILYSRFAHPWIWVPGFAVPAYYFFIRGMKRGGTANFAAAGVFLGIDLYFYSAAKASPLAPLAFVAVLFLRKETRDNVTANWRGLLVMALAAVFVFSPVIDYMIHFPGSYFRRMSGMSALNGIPLKFSDLSGLANNMVKNIQMFFTESAVGYCHNLPSKPFFDPFISFFMLAGAGYLAYTWKRGASMFTALWLFCGLLPGFLSKLGPEDPYPARMVLAIPVLIIVMTLGLERIMAKLESLWPRVLKYVMPIAAIYVFSWFAYNNLHDYFTVFPNDPHTQGYYRYIDKLDADYMMKNQDRNIFISPVLAWNYYYGMLAPLTGPKLDSYVKNEDVSLLELFKIYNDKGRGVTFIGEGIYHKLFPIFREYFPGAVVTTQWNPNFWEFDTDSGLKNCYGWKYPDKTIGFNNMYRWFYMYDNDVKSARTTRAEIPPADINGVFCLDGEFYNGGQKTGRPVIFPFSVEKGGFDGAVISGILDVPDYGSYEFSMEGAQGKLFINGVPAAGGMELYKGLHRIRLILGKTESPAFSLNWKKKDEARFKPVERSYLLRSGKVFGLLATYRNLGKVIYKELEPAIDYRLYYFNKRPAFPFTTDNGYKVEWDGRLLIKETGAYEFKMHTFYDSVITINGKTAYRQLNGKENIYPVSLPAGRAAVNIKADYTYISNYWDPGSTLRFMYKKEGPREFGPVTYDMLSPGF